MNKDSISSDLSEVDFTAAGQPATTSGIRALDLAQLAEVEPTPKSFIIPNLVPAGEVTLLTGPGSAGKSLLAQQLATALAAGMPTLRLNLPKASAIYISCEDDDEQLHWRQAHICQSLQIPMKNLKGSLQVASLRGALDNTLINIAQDGEIELLPAYHALTDLIRRSQAAFVALDNVAHLFGGNENDRGEVTRFVNCLNRLAGDTGAAILLLAHPNKSGDTYSGSTAWLNAVRSQIVIEHDLITDRRKLVLAKANYAKKGEAIAFFWVDCAFVHENDLKPDTAKNLNMTIKAASENAAFLRCLEVCTTQHRNVSHQPGSNFAPQVFAGMPDAKGIKAEGFKAAMERLLHLGQIELDAELWPSSNRHRKRGIRAMEKQSSSPA